MGRKNIYDPDFRYDLLKPGVDWCTRRSYRSIKVAGLENIPTDGAVLLTPNHTNTLMDALVVLQTDKTPKVFGARADLFKQKFIADFMTFARILPMVRQRDGLRNVLKNHESIETIVNTLESGMTFCLYPEGRHRPAHSLQTLGKGAMRAAVAANDKFGKEKPVYIVPVGIEYGDYYRYRNTCLVSFGKPINVTEFVSNLNVESEAQILDPLRKELQRRMSELITYIPDDENLAAKWALTKILAVDFRSTDIQLRMQNNRKVIAEIEKAMESHPERMAELLEEAADFDKNRKKAGVSIFSFRSKKPLNRAIGKGLLALAGLPYYLYSLVAALPMWVTATLLRSKIKDRAFGNTVSFGVKLGLGMIWYPMIIALAFVFAPWPIALVASLLAVPTYNYFYDYNEFLRRLFSDIRLIGRKDLRKKFKYIRKDFSKLK